MLRTDRQTDRQTRTERQPDRQNATQLWLHGVTLLMLWSGRYICRSPQKDNTVTHNHMWRWK